MDEKLLYAQKVQKFQNMKTVGVVLTAVGTVSMIVAVVKINDEVEDLWSTEPEDNTAEIAAVIGTVGLGAGIPLWTVGAYQHKKYNKKLNDISISVKLNSQSSGLMLRYRF
jgi:hypothetical protein